jgi:LCP family protein required for cell wall assembly
LSLIPSSGRGALGRFALGAVIVILFTATATAVAGLLQFKQLAKDISASAPIRHARVVVPNPGAAQTILILGSDHRPHTPISAANSDTIILVRLDPSSSTINVVSIPRDLRVTIPGGGVQKINAAYSLGGPNLVVKTIQLDVFPKLQVNHIVDINFDGFKALVNQIGCVYTDVDRRYFNQNVGTAATDYSNIDIQAGYQKLCGDSALAYVRYRHTDTDIVRSARQQDFIRQAKDQYGQSNLIANRDALLSIFGKHTQTDPDLHSTDGLINLFNLVAFSDAHAIREVHFPAILLPCAPPSPCFVDADPAAEASTFAEFMAPVRSGGTRAPAKPPPAGAAAHRAHTPPPPTAGLTADVADAATQASALGDPGMPVYVPRLIPAGGNYEGPTAGEYPRAYAIYSPQHRKYAAYRIVGAVNATLGQFYGIQGTSWRDPPLLASPSAIMYVGGRRLELHLDGHKLRLVAWRTPHGVYWVSNSLSLDLTNEQMVGLAASLSHA